jgi:multimeric flavodoxin WrbA
LTPPSSAIQSCQRQDAGAGSREVTMRIAIFDGAEAPGPMDAWVAAVAQGLVARGHAVQHVRLRERGVRQCKGCFDCWVKTPGRCGIRDGTDDLVRELLASELLVVASPTSMGMTTALSRRVSERMIPILHPYFELVGGEIHHRARYEHRPCVALLYGAEGCDAEDEQLLVALYRRLAINLRCTFALAASTARAPEEVCDALALP